MIAVNGRTNAGRNPAAIYRDPMTMDDYIAARPITSPVRPLRLRRPVRRVDRRDRVGRVGGRRPAEAGHPHRGGRHRRSSSGCRGTRARSPTSPRCSVRPPTSGRAPSLRPDDVDVALLYDGFTFNAVSWIEALGFCGFGEAQDWLDGGRRIALDGDLPVNPHGGQLSEGRTHGFGFLHEAVTQLRGEAGERQVGGAPTSPSSPPAAAPRRASSSSGATRPALLGRRHRQGLPAPHRGGAGLHGVVPSTSHSGKRLSTSSSATRPFEAGQRRAEAEVDAVAEASGGGRSCGGCRSGRRRGSGGRRGWPTPLSSSMALPSGTVWPWCSTSLVT